MATKDAAGTVNGDKGSYTMLECIGSGTYGKVYKGKDLADESTVAIKKLKWPGLEKGSVGGGIPSSILREVALLKQLDHQNIIRLQDITIQNTHMYLVFEHLSCDLRQYLDTEGPQGLPQDIADTIIEQMLSGLTHMHSKRIMHRDLKPQNILLNRHTMEIKIADLGLSRFFHVFPSTYTHEVVTLWYRAPEVLLGCNTYTASIDVWSAGCIIAELITGTPLLPGDSEVDQIMRTFRLLGTPSEIVWRGVSHLPHFSAQFPSWRPRKLPCYTPHGQQLLAAMLQLNPSTRCTARRALQTHREGMLLD
eukprot:comp17442_c0_seq1/m.16860 comp17442_c0_seq1/g.16860  ORF comp17442_c0_seq1/g.16860 comp17442_c0_seq1/m.16860 type:complete len:307 (-) comp17442_c0_seq1:174-1094(-)